MGKAFVFGDDVDTDQIISSQYIIYPDIAEMAPHAFEALDPGFAKSVQPGDIIVAGQNFGCGSSREQAPAVLLALGVKCVVAKSFARIFFRNAINIGLPALVCADVQETAKTGGGISADIAAGTVTCGGKTFPCTKLPAHMRGILDCGGLLPFLNDEKGTGAATAEHPRSQPAAPATGMTMAEKIIAAAAGVPQVRPGEIHTVKLDGMMSNDGTTHLTIDMYNTKLAHPRVAAPEKMVFVVDHNSPADSPKTAAAHRKMRDFAREHNIAWYEGKGVCHQIMVENHVVPGALYIGADSHTCTYGALGAFGTGVGCTDFLYGLVTGETWMMVPETIRFELTGRLPAGVYARDLMLAIIGDVGADGCNYKVMEFAGEGLAAMDLSERLVLSNLAVEAGAKTALMEADEKVLEYVEGRGRAPKAVCKSDADAQFAAVHKYDLSKMVPVAARPHRIDDVVPLSEVAGVKIDEAFLGSCNNGRIEDLRVAAGIVNGKTVAPKVRFIVAPASNEVYRQVLAEGLIDVFLKAGAMVVNSNCSVCWGSCQGVIGPGEVLISTGTRNFKGRAGSPDSFVYLGSAATVAASALAGEIAAAR